MDPNHQPHVGPVVTVVSGPVPSLPSPLVADSALASQRLADRPPPPPPALQAWSYPRTFALALPAAWEAVLALSWLFPFLHPFLDAVVAQAEACRLESSPSVPSLSWVTSGE